MGNKKAMQKTVDAALVKTVGKDQAMKKYPKSKFALSNGDKPHEMKF